jgi:oxygen-independent coproporphyrinogen-3 oxidase
VGTVGALPGLGAAGPRYTSYPTADRFDARFGAPEYEAALRARWHEGGTSRPLGLYVHLPFCESICYYCGCNKVVTRDHGRAGEYLDALALEVELLRRLRGEGAGGDDDAVSELHLGGGTPTWFDDRQLARLMVLLQHGFRIAAGAERAIEIDPRTVSAERLQTLAALGFDRLSFGVQDFDPAVQQAVHRVQPYRQVAALMDDARRLGFGSINVDLIYGLPMQTAASFERTLEQLCHIRPDRVALYGYAHLPERFKPQRRIDAAALPAPAQKVGLLQAAIERLGAAGYEHIGMDHFALAGDSLAVARRQGRLHRNFQGYTTRPDADLIGLGVSAISSVGASFAQNAKTLGDYYGALSFGRLPTERGLALSADDLRRRAVILAIMCQGRVDFADFEARHGVRFQALFAAELAALRELEQQGVVVLDDKGFGVTPQGWFVVRAVAMVFDAYAQAGLDRARYSRIA